MEANTERIITLDLLPETGWATVAGVTVPIEPADRNLVLRLMELGFVPGERVHVVREGRPGHDPLAVRLGHTTFALRRREAAFIQVIPAA
ncbi:MAG TPA: FeoA family protein [Flavobacteriales bacterium]|nr:FeoA family protein [Flavobacteriales bacterium]